jgi:hypothetical protein
MEALRVDMGMFPHFEFDSHCNHWPCLAGHVVAALTVSPELEASLVLYPVRFGDYPPNAISDFRERILPSLRI